MEEQKQKYMVLRIPPPQVLKIYIQDWGWRGHVLVIAASEEDARKLMEADHNYLPEAEVEEHDLVEGFMYGHDGS